jgi:hypothetical protein
MVNLAGYTNSKKGSYKKATVTKRRKVSSEISQGKNIERM